MTRGTAFLQEHVFVSSFVIRCSFCENIIRKDVPPSKNERHIDGLHLQTKNHADELARNAGWKSGETTHGAQLNFCPDHVALAKEMGIFV